VRVENDRNLKHGGWGNLSYVLAVKFGACGNVIKEEGLKLIFMGKR